LANHTSHHPFPDPREQVVQAIRLGGQTTAAAQLGGEGASTSGALSVSPGVWVYQLADDGLALEPTAKGTKYYKDDELN
jgi:hypothetical protein